MLTLTNITYAYKNNSFYFDLKAQAGTISAILGASGAGKSTLLALIAGFLKPNSGDILWQGESILLKKPSNRKIGFIFQEHNLFNHLTVKENIIIAVAHNLKPQPKQLAELLAITSKLKIEKYLNSYPEDLSGGEKQRVAIARALICKHPIMLLDEPFSALDPAMRSELLELLQEITKTRNLCVLMVTHNIQDALQIADQAILIANGKTAISATPKDLLTNTENSELIAYLGKS